MSIKILIVEDNEDYRELISLFLEMKGFEICIAENGLEAVELSQTNHPNIILMDLNLPVLDGWEATRLISQNSATKHIPIIAVSANCSNHYNKDIIKAGAVGCIQKPVDIESLPDIILSYAVNKTT